MQRPPIPGFIADVFEDGAARNGLIAGTLALVAAALDPQVWGPSLPSVQSAVREHPQLEALAILVAVTGSALLLLGGALGDSARARPIILGGLSVELIAAVVSLLVPSGAVFFVARIVGHASAAFVIPVSIALVATSYRGVARATAIGLAYGAYGAAGGAAPILLQVIPGQRWPAFAVAIAVVALALWIVRDRIADLPRPRPAERRYVVGTAIWALGIVMLTVGITWFGGGVDNPLRWALIMAGSAILGLAVLHDRWRSRRSAEAVRIDRRPVAVAIFVGLVLAIAQTAPMLELPLYFHLIKGFGPILAVVALAPLIVALAVAGPVAGYLLGRVTPRWLVGVGAVVVGAGNLLLALITTSSAGYLEFVLPSLLVGAGFVIATTVRTAIIFASVPRGLPATAAALNEASIFVGARVGTVLVTAVVAEVALAAYSASVAGLPAANAAAAIASFNDLLVAVGTPSFDQVARSIGSVDVQPYVEAYAMGLAVALAASGVIAVVGGIIALALLGRRDPLRTVYELDGERGASPSLEPEANA